MKNVKRCLAALLAAIVVIASAPVDLGVFAVTAEAAQKPVLSAKKAVLGVGETMTLKLKNNKKKVKWSTSSGSIASVNKKGKVKALKAGKVKITAKVGNKKYTCSLTVKAGRLSCTSAVLVEKSKLNLKLFGAAHKAAFKTSNSKVAVVSSKGTVTAKKAGKVVITAISGKKKYPCSIRVIKKPVLNVEEKELLIGDTFNLVLKNAVGKVEWSCDDPDILSVSSSGVVKALEDGDAEVTAEYLGKKYTCDIYVLFPEIDAGEEWLIVGETMQLKLLYNRQPVTWSSSDPKVLTISQTGLAKGISEGTATVVARAGGFEYEVEIDVESEDDADWDDDDPDDGDLDDDDLDEDLDDDDLDEDLDDDDLDEDLDENDLDEGLDAGDLDDGDLDGDPDDGDPDETGNVVLRAVLGETYGNMKSIVLR